MRRCLSPNYLVVFVFISIVVLAGCNPFGTSAGPAPDPVTSAPDPRPESSAAASRPSAETTAAADAPISDSSPAPASDCAPKVSAEEFWQIQLQRQTEMRDYLQAIADITDAEERRDLDTQHQERMQAVLTDAGLKSVADLAVPARCRDEIQAEQQQYINDNPDLQKQFFELSDEMRKLKK
jgi:hypothetical protein